MFKLISLRSEIPALQADGEFGVLLNSYPFVYERTADKKYYVAINPSKYTHTYTLPSMSKVLLSQNVEYEGNTLIMKSTSFIIAEA